MSSPHPEDTSQRRGKPTQGLHVRQVGYILYLAERAPEVHVCERFVSIFSASWILAPSRISMRKLPFLEFIFEGNQIFYFEWV